MPYTGIEQIFYEGAMSTVGDPIYIGILVIGFFAACVMFQGQRLDGIILMMIFAFFLAGAFMPIWLLTIGIFAFAFIIFIGLMRLITR